MKTSHLLLLAAASIAPIQAVSAQDAPAPAPAATTPPALSPLEISAAINPSLAQIAPGQDFISVTNIAQLADELVAAGLASKEDMAEMKSLPVTSLTIANKFDTSIQNYAAVQKLLMGTHLSELIGNWAATANPSYAPALQAWAAANAQLSPEEAMAAIKIIAESKMEPLYISASLTPMVIPMVAMYLPQIPAEAAASGLDLSCTAKDGAVEICIPASTFVEMIPSAANEEELKLIVDAFDGLALYATIELKGRCLNVALALSKEAPTFQWAASVEESILASEDGKFTQNKESDKAFFLSSISAEALDAMNKFGIMPMAEQFAGIFNKLAADVPADAAVQTKAAQGTMQLAKALEKLSPALQHGTSTMLWFDEGFHADIQYDLTGTYLPFDIGTEGLVEDTTISAMMSSGFVMKGYDFQPLIEAAPATLDIAEAITLSLDKSDAAEIMPVLQLAKASLANPSSAPAELRLLLNTLQACAPACEKMLTSMGTSFGYTLRAGYDSDEPQFVSFASLSSKQGFTEGFTELYSVLSNTAASCGIPVPPISPEVTEASGVTSYTLKDDDITLQASLSDKLISLSNAPTLNQAVQISTKSSEVKPAAGAFFYLNFANLQPLLDGCCAEEELEGYKSFTEPFEGLIMTIESESDSSTKGALRISMPLK